MMTMIYCVLYQASSGRDVHTVRAAAELALSVLPHAHALNYNEIQRAVLQCKEQSDAMLERACLTVEAAAKGKATTTFVKRSSYSVVPLTKY